MLQRLPGLVDRPPELCTFRNEFGIHNSSEMVEVTVTETAHAAKRTPQAPSEGQCSGAQVDDMVRYFPVPHLMHRASARGIGWASITMRMLRRVLDEH